MNSQALNKEHASQNSSITRQPKESTKRSGTTGGTASGAAHKKAMLARSMQKEPESQWKSTIQETDTSIKANNFIEAQRPVSQTGMHDFRPEGQGALQDYLRDQQLSDSKESTMTYQKRS